MPDFPPDTAPNVVRRYREYQTLSRAEIGQRMLRAQRDVAIAAEKMTYVSDIEKIIRDLPNLITTDAVALEISQIIEAIDVSTSALTRNSCRGILRLFVLAEHVAGPWEAVLRKEEDPGKRLEICTYINNYVHRRMTEGELIEEGKLIEAAMVMPASRDPGYVGFLLKGAMQQVADKWKTLATTDLKRKFVLDIFDSTKGFPKTARTIEEWVPPSDFDFATYLDEWLNGFSNTSIYDSSKGGKTQSRKAWIEEEHGSASGDQKKMMWIQFAGQLAGKAGLEYDGAKIMAYLAARKVAMRAKLPASIPDSDLNSLVTRDLQVWWTSIM